MGDSHRWGILVTHGDDMYLHMRHCIPLLFKTKREASVCIRQDFGYITKRSDLRKPPHNWRMPKPVRVTVTVDTLELEGK